MTTAMQAGWLTRACGKCVAWAPLTTAGTEPGTQHSLSCRYPITLSRPGCYGDRNSLPGVRSYGQREPGELYDVYCYARELQGKQNWVMRGTSLGATVGMGTAIQCAALSCREGVLCHGPRALHLVGGTEALPGPWGCLGHHGAAVLGLA